MPLWQGHKSDTVAIMGNQNSSKGTCEWVSEGGQAQGAGDGGSLGGDGGNLGGDTEGGQSKYTKLEVKTLSEN